MILKKKEGNTYVFRFRYIFNDFSNLYIYLFFIVYIIQQFDR